MTCGELSCSDLTDGGISCKAADECIAGTSFPADDGCNTCVCPASGVKSEAACTLLACVEDPCMNKGCGDACSTCDPDVDGCAAVEEYCQPDRSCKSDQPVCEGPCTDKACGDSCTTCDPFKRYCTDAGDCVEDVPTCAETCEPGTSFPAEDGCNNCTCPENGKPDEAICTQIACVATCNTHNDCSQPDDTCFTPGEPVPCGPCMSPEEANTCETDAERSTDGGPLMVCEQSNVGDCLCESATICKPGCESVDDCGTGETCGAGHCLPNRCDDQTPCPTDFGCNGDGDGECQRKACGSSDECDGECVKGSCYPTKGTCMPVPA
ncbi:MAG: hypothetical protein ACI9OJ_004557 [Myxococcota bacterium]